MNMERVPGMDPIPDTKKNSMAHPIPLNELFSFPM